MKKIILASSSPRRKELIKRLGVKFKIDPGNYEEDLSLKLKPHELVKFLSKEKAKSVAKKYKNAIIIAADTLNFLEGKMLCKPKTMAEARKMLKDTSGKCQSVITGFTIIDTKKKKILSKSVETKVYFRKLSLKEINAYLKKGESSDKAGAYAIQGVGAILIKKIEGDYYNVVGLPLATLAEEIKKFGIKVL